MKRRFAVVLCAVLGCAIAAPAHASPLQTSGELRARWWHLDSYSKNEQRDEFWDQRLRLSFDWDAGELVNVHARANILEGKWGDSVARPAIVFDQANVQFVWPGTPLRLTVGRQDVSWGTGYWVQEDNRDRMAVGLKLDRVSVLFAYDKFAEVYTEHGVLDDSRAWAVGAITNAAGFRLGLLVANLRDESRSRFPAGDLAYWAGGLFAVGSIGPVGTRAEVVYGTGTIDRSGVPDLDLRGVGAYASASLPLGPVSLMLEGAYAGGDDATTPNRLEGFFSADYQGPFWSVVFYNNFDLSGYAGDAQASWPEADFSVRNARAGKITASFAPLRRLRIAGAVLYASADQARAGGTGNWGGSSTPSSSTTSPRA